MPNKLLRRDEFAQNVIDSARRAVETMSLSVCENLATCGVRGVGINAGMAVALIHASQLRVARQPGIPEPAD